jgi:ABC-type nitrate/sulfonate/bicarbonate transport system substrate-binding protein
MAIGPVALFLVWHVAHHTALVTPRLLPSPGASAGITVRAEAQFPGVFKVFGLQGGGIADPFYSGVSLLTARFLRKSPALARRFVEPLDEATQRAEQDYTRLRTILPRWTAVQPAQLELVDKLYLRAWRDVNETELNSYQALVDIFSSEGVLRQPMAVRDLILKLQDLAV